MHGIRISGTGGPGVLEWADLPEPRPGPGEIVVKTAAAGVNFIDIYHRTGLYPMELPLVPGVEGAGTVEAVGDGVDGFRPGDRVAWALAPRSYAELSSVPAARAVHVPDGVGLEDAAAVLLQGLTAHYLAIDTFALSEGDRCLVHAGAGGVGLLLIQIARMRGAEVFTTVGSDEKARLAADAGAQHVINYRDRSFRDEIVRTAGEKPIDVVYDGVGKAVFWDSMDLIRPRGLMAQFGNASGAVDPFSPLELSRRGSLFLTRPTLGHYIATREELDRRAADLFEWMEGGSLRVHIGDRIPLRDAAEAHRRLEARLTTGKVLLLP